jgi:hypothetical protein
MGVTINAVRSDLRGFDWQNGNADFDVPGDDAQILRVSFEGGVIVRMLDEMALSTESDPSTWVGLVPKHFAYRVEGHPFFEAQSEVWRLGLQMEHYCFMTGCGCLDVVTCIPPKFYLVARA